MIKDCRGVILLPPSPLGGKKSDVGRRKETKKAGAEYGWKRKGRGRLGEKPQTLSLSGKPEGGGTNLAIWGPD